MKKLVNLRYEQLIKIYNLFGAYITQNVTWPDSLNFHLFVVHNRRILQGYTDDFEEIKSKLPEYLEYEEKSRKFLQAYRADSSFDLNKAIDSLIEEYKDVEDVKKGKELLNKDVDVELMVISSSDLPKGSLSAGELDVLYDLIELEE
jgi:hypothetical protein